MRDTLEPFLMLAVTTSVCFELSYLLVRYVRYVRYFKIRNQSNVKSRIPDTVQLDLDYLTFGVLIIRCYQ